MRLTQLEIKNFRNIENVQLNPVRGVNLIVGNNASGKTSLLEAIYYLSHVRSFRTQHVTDLILRQSPYLQLVAKIETSEQQLIPLGIRRSRNKSQIRVNKQPIKRVSDIAAQFPVLAIHPDSYKLITGSPSQRRQYLDWGVFHVEHGFFQAWQRFRKALMQRNAALKSKQKFEVCQLWNNEINNTAHYIDQLRQQYFEKLLPYFYQLTKQFFTGDVVDIEYKRGWPEDKQLIDLLEENLQKERMRGYTGLGPHRAEITIKVNNQSAQTCISRGQQKTLVALMRLSQAMQFTEATNKPCVLLYDDLAAELDEKHREQILAVLSTMNIQLFLTAIEEQQINLAGWNVKKMFHVEHGKLSTEVNS
ncbi:MAG: DNA replication/repair protein RecF [Gammaproteobacteria bacterium]|nr:DNA replication/repair protein RecF [Gammaproteobacteria bacterium]